MSELIDDEADAEPFEVEDEFEVIQRTEGLNQASKKRKHQIWRRIEEVEEKRRFREMFEGFDDY